MAIAQWKEQVIRSVQEVVGHPFGGKVEVFVLAQDNGQKVITSVPYLNGRSKGRIVLEQCDD